MTDDAKSLGVELPDEASQRSPLESRESVFAATGWAVYVGTGPLDQAKQVATRLMGLMPQ